MNELLKKEVEEIAGDIMDQLCYNWIDYSIETLKDFIEEIYCNAEGVYFSWNDTYYSNIDEAVECFKNDEGAIFASLHGYVVAEERPFIISYNNDVIYNIDSFEDFEKINKLKELMENVYEFIYSKEKQQLEQAIPEVKKESKSLKI